MPRLITQKQERVLKDLIGRGLQNQDPVGYYYDIIIMTNAELLVKVSEHRNIMIQEIRQAKAEAEARAAESSSAEESITE